ncbi:hypothetical protein GCM10009613_36620 [Pseudonocardia kongjuensis]|uniref:Uncharacterized protein n=1 Tax=Pseudonocardia kongjuensis TaxID=102227 RepID=A0ABN1Y251_9PSEU
MALRLPAIATVSAKIATLATIRPGTSTGRPVRLAPATLRARGTAREDCARQSTQCWPTDAGRRHSGQAGRSHRVQRSPVGRSGCRAHTGGPPRAGGGAPGGGVGPGAPGQDGPCP